MVKRMNSNKKILISILAFIAVIGLITAVLYFLGRENSAEQPGQYDEFFGNLEYLESEKLTSAEMENSPAMDDHKMSDSEMSVIGAFVSGTYYISMVDMNDPSQTQLDMAVSGENFQMGVEIEGIKLDCMLYNDNFYIITSNRKYVDMNSLASMVGESEAFDTSSMKEVTSMLDVTRYNFKSVKPSDGMVGNTPAICHTFFADDVELSFYFVSDELRRISLKSTSGTDVFDIEVKNFQSTIPSGMLTLTGLKKANIIDFMTEIGLQMK